MINILKGKVVCFSFAFFTCIEFCCWMGRKFGLLVKTSRIHSIEQTALSKIEKKPINLHGLDQIIEQNNKIIEQRAQLFNTCKTLAKQEDQRRIKFTISLNNIEREQAEIREQQAENKKNRKRNKKSLKVIEQRTDELGLKLADLKMDTERFISDLRERKSLREREN
jgi:hypothetical protein